MKKNKKFLFLTLVVVAFFVLVQNVRALAPTVTTDPASSVSAVSATLNGNITDTGGVDATEHGFTYGTDPTLTTVIATSTLGAQVGTGAFTEDVAGLTEGTTYYFRAYAINTDGTAYGTIRSFTTIFTSNAPWFEHTSSGQRSWQSITSSSDGTKLAAVNQGGYIYTSVDSGVTWTEQTGSGQRIWQSITSSSDGTKLAAVNNNGYIYTSVDSGVTWTEQTGSGQHFWRSITSSSDGTKLAASSNGYIYTSGDSGITWTEQTGSDQRNWLSITSSSDGTKLATFTNGNYIYTSGDSGVTWTEQTGSGQRIWLSITSSSDGTKLAAVDQGSYIYTSVDSGVTWTEQTGSGQRNWSSITSSLDGTKLAAVVSGGYIYTSEDSGVTWTEQTGSGQRGWYSITSSSDGTKLAAVHLGGYIYTFPFVAVLATVTTDPASSVSAVSATLNGNITDTGGVDATEHGFTYGTDPTLTTVIATSTLGAQVGTGAFTEDITGLTGGTTYYFRAYATNSAGTGLGAIVSFTTSAITQPSVATSAASSVTTTTATLNGSINDTGFEDATEHGFAYGTDPTLTTVIATSTLGAQVGTGAFTEDITGLTGGTTYYFRAYATNSAGTGLGAIVSFTTSAITQPSVATSAASSVTTTTATLNGSINDTGFEDATEHGFAYGTDPTLTTVIATSTLGAQVGTGAFTEDITGLTGGTTYYFRAYAINSAGTGFGTIQTFTTSSLVSPTVTTDPASSVSAVSATLNGNITDTGGVDATEHGFTYGTDPTLTTVIATSTLGAQVGTGAFTEDITGLTGGTTYYFRAYAINSDGTSFGTIRSFTTSSFSNAPWKQQTGSGQRFWSSITSSSDGTKLAAVEEGGYIYTSGNSGLTWTEQTDSGQRNWIEITSSFDGTKLVAVGYDGYIYTSGDSGITWTEQTDSGQRNWASITSSSLGTKLAAVDQGGYIYTSGDSGVTWIEQIGSDIHDWTSITSSSDGTKLAAVAGEESGYIYTSEDSGVTWIEQTGSGQRNWWSITSSSDGTKLASVDKSGYIYTSGDSGITWTEQTGSGQRFWSSITSSTDGTKLAAVEQDGYIYTSGDSGVTWIQQTEPGQRSWQSITSSSDGTKLASVDYGGYIYTFPFVADPPFPWEGNDILYGSDGAGNNGGVVNLYTLDPRTGNILTTIGPTGHNINGMAFHPTTGVLYGDTSNGDPNGNKPFSLFTIDTETGATTFLGIIQDDADPVNTYGFADIAFRSDGRLYARPGSNSSNLFLYTIDSACPLEICLATQVGDTNIGDGTGAAVAFDSNDNLYIFDNENSSFFYKVDADTGEIITSIPYSNPSSEGRVIVAAKFEDDDILFASRSSSGQDPSDLVVIDVVTGAITSTGENNPVMPFMTALAFRIVPDPTCSDGIQNQDETGIDTGGVCGDEDGNNNRGSSSGGRRISSRRTPTPTPTTTTIFQSPSTPALLLGPLFSITRDLSFGHVSEEVKALQVYLNTLGFKVSENGPGSPGAETLFFGPATRAALARFQSVHLIFPALGYYGPITRAYVSTFK